MPVVLALMFLGVQAALLYMGRTAAHAAAEQGVQVAAGERGTLDGGIAAAQGLADASAMALDRAAVTGSQTPRTVTITVSVRVNSLMPGWDPHVTATAAMDREAVSG